MVVRHLVTVAQRYALATLFALSGIVGCHGCKSQLNWLSDSWGFAAAAGISSAELQLPLARGRGDKQAELALLV